MARPKPSKTSSVTPSQYTNLPVSKKTAEAVTQLTHDSHQKAVDEADVPNIMFDRVTPPPMGPVSGFRTEKYDQRDMLTTEDSLARGKAWYNDPTKMQAVQSDLYSAGFIYNSAGLNNYSGFSGGLERALEAYTLESPEIRRNETFVDWLSRRGGEGDRSKSGSGGSGGSGGSSTFAALTNEFDAEVLINSTLGTYLGRDATEKEIDAFWKQLNKSERANPLTTTPSGSSGGYNKNLAAEKFAEQSDDYADTTANVTLKGLMTNAIRSRMGDTLEGML